MDTNTVNEILQVLKTALTSGVDAVQSQFPILCEQIIRFATLSASIGLVMSFGISIACILINIKGQLILKEDKYSDGGLSMIIASSIIGIVALVAFGAFIYDLTKVLTAPNLVLLEALRGMVK
jgi:hypothetical protein